MREDTEGVIQGHVLGTYLHGPVLARNPGLADRLLCWAMGIPALPALDLPEVTALQRERLATPTTHRLIATVRTALPGRRRFRSERRGGSGNGLDQKPGNVARS
jgi:hypothetical protein